jgi:hypothetical protein
MRRIPPLAAITLTVALIFFGGTGQAQLLDQYDQGQIQDKYLSCVQIEKKLNGVYNTDDTPAQAQKRCWADAFFDVFVDKCVSLDHSWLKFGTRGKCEATAKKFIGE